MRSYVRSCLVAAVALGCAFSSAQVAAQSDRGLDARKKAVVDFWTSERRANAIPRDLVIDERGLGYLKHPDGSLQPYGHQVAALAKTPMAKPGGGTDDTTAPTISNPIPTDGATIPPNQQFSVVVTDSESGVKSVRFNFQPDGGLVQSVNGILTTDNTWVVSGTGLSGSWSWWVEAKDNGSRGGNTAISPTYTFSVDGGDGGGGDPPPPPPSGGTVTNAPWGFGGAVQTAAGRIYFQMPANSKWKGPWNGYVCSGTVATESTSGRSVIITAAHCVYDDANKAFAANVLFIPDQDGTSASGTNRSCGDDPIGCWVTSFGVVDVDWTTRTFPNNIPWDYAYYVVDDSGSHSIGLDKKAYGALDGAAGSLGIQFGAPTTGDVTHALGYSYSDDPNFMYCKEGMTTNGNANWWLASCQLSGGSSGGPWVQPMNEGTGSGPIISVNSWGYTTSDGMAGPKLNGTSAACLFEVAKSESIVDFADGEAGYASNCN